MYFFGVDETFNNIFIRYFDPRVNVATHSGRRMDMLEQRSSQSDNNTRNLLEQNMKLRQDIMVSQG